MASICPVCKLVLPNVSSVQNHLEVHSKQEVVSALLRNNAASSSSLIHQAAVLQPPAAHQQQQQQVSLPSCGSVFQAPQSYSQQPGTSSSTSTSYQQQQQQLHAAAAAVLLTVPQQQHEAGTATASTPAAAPLGTATYQQPGSSAANPSATVLMAVSNQHHEPAAVSGSGVGPTTTTLMTTAGTMMQFVSPVLIPQANGPPIMMSMPTAGYMYPGISTGTAGTAIFGGQLAPATPVSSQQLQQAEQVVHVQTQVPTASPVSPQQPPSRQHLVHQQQLHQLQMQQQHSASPPAQVSAVTAPSQGSSSSRRRAESDRKPKVVTTVEALQEALNRSPANGEETQIVVSPELYESEEFKKLLDANGATAG